MNNKIKRDMNNDFIFVDFPKVTEDYIHQQL